MREMVVQAGMEKKLSKLFMKKLEMDEKAYPCDEATKEWAMSKGFFPGRVELYGLNENNYRHYVSDYCDFMLHPYNNHFRIWISDKLSLKYTISSDISLSKIMPEYYLYIENNGDYTYLMDVGGIAKDEDFVINLLKAKGVLMIKPNSSTSGGYGVMKIEWVNGHIRINNEECVAEQEFAGRLGKLKNNIVTEYCYQHKELKKIWPSTECTLRVVMIKLPHEHFYSKPKWKCIVSYARFGSEVSGGASNLSSGGIGVGFDFQTGKYNEFGIRYKQFCPDGNWKCYQHPDTKVVWKGAELPNWDYVRDTIYMVCNHFDSLDHMGMDIIITDEGFIFCEINVKPALNYEQVMCGPILADAENVSYFQNKGMYEIETARFWTIYKECQSE